MMGPPCSVLDELYGAQAMRALLAGDLESALDALGRASTRYVAGFLCRLGLLMPSISARLACGLARRRLGCKCRASGPALPRAASLPSFGAVKWRRAERRGEVLVWLAGSNRGRPDNLLPARFLPDHDRRDTTIATSFPSSTQPPPRTTCQTT